VFWEAWKRAKDYDSRRATVVAWLALIARSRAVDHLRRRRPAVVDPLSNEVLQPAGESCVSERVEARDAAQAALATLPDEQRSLIMLSFYGGMTHGAIAEARSLPLGTVKTRIRTGMQQLRAYLGSEEEARA
jgi:RNA polymerase sigma-70 factor (ECF subfamily)